MRVIAYIIAHCSDSDVPAHDNIETIREWHTARGFTGPDGIEGTHDDVGYNYFLDKAGNVFIGRPEDKVGAHCRGFNSKSIGICLSGRKEFTQEQFKAFEKLCHDICTRYGLSKSDILPHCELDALKTCPNFDLHALVSSWSWH